MKSGLPQESRLWREATRRPSMQNFPKLLERSGNFENGSITGVYTVLVEGDDTNEPVADTVRGILDGHIVLTRKLANEGHFPAIDIGASISRLMTSIVSREHQDAASGIRNILSIYMQNEDLVSIGAYKAGTNPKLDYAISKINQVNDFLMQKVDEKFTYEEIIAEMERILAKPKDAKKKNKGRMYNPKMRGRTEYEKVCFCFG